MEEYAPLLQGSVEHGLQGIVVVHHHEAAPGGVAFQGGVEVGDVHVLRWRDGHCLLHVLQGFSLREEEESLECFGRQGRLHFLQLVGGGDVPHRGQQVFRHAQAQQLAVPDGFEQRAGLGCYVSGRGSFDLLAGKHLQSAGGWVDGDSLVLAPGFGLVVVVHPEQDVDVALLRFEHHGPVSLVDSHGA